jgi:hypothetical protein
VSNDGDGDLRAGAVQVGDRIAVLFEQERELGVERGDALVAVLDVAREVADAAGRDLFDQPVAETDSPETAQLALSGEVDHAALADGVDLIPVGAEPLDGLGAVADEATSLELEQRQRPHELRFERRTELRAVAQHNLRDGDRIARIGLAGAMATTLAMCAPGRHIEHLVPRRFQ